MSTSVSVMKPGNTMRRCFREDSFSTSTFRYVRSNIFFILFGKRNMYGRGDKWIVYTLAASPMKHLLKLKILQYFRLSN